MPVIICVTQFLQAQPSAPKFQSFQPVSSSRTPEEVKPSLPGNANPLLLNDPYREQNNRLLQQAGVMPGIAGSKQQKINEVRNELKEDEEENKEAIHRAMSRPFQDNFQQFLQLNPDSFSLTKAVYLSESAYYSDPPPPSFQQFQAAIQQGAELVKQILKREGLNETDNTSVLYAIQKLYTQANNYHNSKTGQTVTIEKLHYDFNDFMGDKDWTKMFVTKVLQTGTGQCHNLPLLFLCIAEQLHAKAWLSLAPNHSFVQYFDKKGNRYNFEATNGNLMSETFLTQGTFITATALKNKTYLDTLSGRKLYAQCLGDLLMSYVMKLGYDNISDQITQKILSIDSANLTGLAMQARLYYFMHRSLQNAANHPPQQEYAKYPELNAAYNNLQFYRHKIDQTGFQLMPQEAYEAWLKSLDAEKQKQENKLEQERMEREIKRLKNLKSTLINKTKE